MATITISKIQLRRGLQADLPGIPTSTNPTVYSTPLDIGELAYTTDSGRVFVGSDPTAGGPTASRTSFPYQNIEVLTENSIVALQASFDAAMRDVQTGFLTTQVLPFADAAATVTLLIGGNVVPLVLGLTAEAALVNMSYFLFNGTTPVRCGRLSAWYDGSGASPQLIDEAVSTRRLDLSGGDDPTNANTVYGSVQFSAALVGSAPHQSVVLQYSNAAPDSFTLMLRLERPTTAVGVAGTATYQQPLTALTLTALLASLPTTHPGTSGVLWNNNGAISLS